MQRKIKQAKKGVNKTGQANKEAGQIFTKQAYPKYYDNYIFPLQRGCSKSKHLQNVVLSNAAVAFKRGASVQ